MERPFYIGNICPHCGAKLVCKQAVDGNADDSDFICSNDICYYDQGEVFFMDLPPEEFENGEVWPFPNKTFKELQTIIKEAGADRIIFYSTQGEYGCFSNFSRHKVSYKSVLYQTSEHAYQAQKFFDKGFQAKVARAATPKEAANLGRNMAMPLRKDWESVKLGIMREVVRAKFSQNEECKATLLSTGNCKIVECTENDQFWAWSQSRGGENWLGRILMEIRSELTPA
jgi:ribA/ribD-fused uncharacterized protein